MQSDVILEARGLGKEFSGFTAVDKVSLGIRKGDIHAIIGPNGAGKTTFFNLLTNFVKPSRGQVFLDGVEITGKSPAYIANLGMVRSFQISAVFGQLTALQNVRIALQKRAGRGLDFWSANKSLQKYDERAREILSLVRLESVAGRHAIELPYGQKRALELATTIALEPRVILLDEPTQGMGHEDVDHIMQLVRQVAVNRTVVMVEHNMKVVAGISDRITVLARGMELASGTYAEVAANDQVLEAYMGRKKQRAAGQ